MNGMKTKIKVIDQSTGIWFEEAQTVFDDPNSRVFMDEEHSDLEDRFLILGLSATGRLLIVIHCYRKVDSLVRIISARRRQNGRLENMKKEYDLNKMKEIPNPYLGKKKAVGINLSPQVIDYFKKLAEEAQIPYQKLIDLYLLDCVKKRKKLSLKWAA